MDNSLKALVNSYELEQSYSPVRHKYKSGEDPNTHQSSQPTKFMSTNAYNNGNSSHKYVPPHRKKTTNGSSEGVKETTKLTNLTEDEKMAKRRERFAAKSSNTTRQPHDYGLISRGEDTRLKESETLREEYFLVILRQFIKYTSTNTSKSLFEAFKRIKDSDPTDFANAQSLKAEAIRDKQTVNMESLALSLRKLRESLLYLKPSPFHKKVFLFSMRISYCCGQYQTYIPSINFLLQNKDELKLSSLEVEEIAIVLILHLTHFNNDIPQAIQTHFRYISNRKDILQIIRSWVHKDYYTWVRIYNSVENYAIKSMMGMGQRMMVNRMIQILNSSYFTIKKSVLENDLLPDDVRYEDFVRDYKVNWTVDDGGVVTIRRRQSRKG
ncbi:hypothetical protein KGF57_002502 [Candida theae]|uniref:CSN8/PSMD8/EIF3K domain-containing protein n=1 Tax=Candida theae TaxID=1198502 RepID=A0AAD5FYR8_9ASCO|nr:uncharacterized protein KGF57_002502 [Candida theae]KAI5958657.1 hypothetical protein KGF57_002502 [Candida theae]